MKSNYAKVIHFNPRSPRGERPIFRVQGAENGKFQSTLPAWGATFLFLPLLRWHVISIHAPRVGSDTISTNADNRYTIFQSTLPAWGATKHLLNRLTFFRISIHAPRVGSDSRIPCIWQGQEISIHAPRVGSDELKAASTSK